MRQALCVRGNTWAVNIPRTWNDPVRPRSYSRLFREISSCTRTVHFVCQHRRGLDAVNTDAPALSKGPRTADATLVFNLRLEVPQGHVSVANHESCISWHAGMSRDFRKKHRTRVAVGAGRVCRTIVHLTRLVGSPLGWLHFVKFVVSRRCHLLNQ